LVRFDENIRHPEVLKESQRDIFLTQRTQRQHKDHKDEMLTRLYT